MLIQNAEFQFQSIFRKIFEHKKDLKYNSSKQKYIRMKEKSNILNISF